MKQTKLFEYEKRIIYECKQMKPIVCDVVLADKMKRMVKDGKN